MPMLHDGKAPYDGAMIKELEGSTGVRTRDASIRDDVVQELRDSLKTSEADVLTPDSEGYSESIKRWSDAIEKRAGIVVYVATPQDVSTCIQFCRKHSIDFVVCGGKHSSSGASSTEGGLVIDLSKRMRKVEVDPATKTIRVGGGCIWKDVDEAAGPHNLAMVGGTINHTGVGGLVLGGGYGWLSGRHGLTIDDLLEVEMVLADGSIKIASEKENPDLFWAVRGAGHSFGVATEFKFQGHDQGDIWAGQIVFDPNENLVPIIDFANYLAVVTDGDSAMAMALVTPPFLQKPAIVTTLFYNGPQHKAEMLFAPLLKLNAIKKDYGMRPYQTMNSILNFAVEYGGRKCTKGASAITPLSYSFVQNLLLDIELFHKSLPNVKKTMINIEIFSPEKWCSVPRGATSYYNRGRYQNVVIGPYWEDPAYDTAGRTWARNIAKKFKLEIEWRRKMFGDPNSTQDIREYGNYDGLRADSRIIFGDNFDRLIALKHKYDPDDLFNKDYAFSSAQQSSKVSDAQVLEQGFVDIGKPAIMNGTQQEPKILPNGSAAAPMNGITGKNLPSESGAAFNGHTSNGVNGHHETRGKPEGSSLTDVHKDGYDGDASYPPPMERQHEMVPPIS